jgi:hypothetical protein
MPQAIKVHDVRQMNRGEMHQNHVVLRARIGSQSATNPSAR